MARSDDDVINSSSDPNVAIHISVRTVACKLLSRSACELYFQESSSIAPHASCLPWPSSFEAHLTLYVISIKLFITVDVKNCNFDTWKGVHRTSGLGLGAVGQVSDHVTASLSLPESVDYVALILSNHRVLPFPFWRFDGLAHSPQDSDRRSVPLLDMIIALLHQRTQCSRSSVEHSNFVLLT